MFDNYLDNYIDYVYKKIITIIIIINPIMSKEKRSLKTFTEVKQAKMLKSIIMTPHPYPPTFLPRYPVLNPPEKMLDK